MVFGPDRFIAGDYSKFDKRMIADFVLAAWEVILMILEAAGWSIEELCVVAGIAYDCSFPLTNIIGDLVEFFGTNPSGHPLTVIINSIVNALYMRYAFTVLHPNGTTEDFKKFVRLITYGDDNAGAVSKEAPWFNHTAVQEVLAAIGVTYTMADKQAECPLHTHR